MSSNEIKRKKDDIRSSNVNPLSRMLGLDTMPKWAKSKAFIGCTALVFAAMFFYLDRAEPEVLKIIKQRQESYEDMRANAEKQRVRELLEQQQKRVQRRYPSPPADQPTTPTSAQ